MRWLIVLLMVTGCKQEPVASNPPSQNDNSRVPLSWEKGSPERKEWSEYLHSLLTGDMFEVFDQAKDASVLCPKYQSLKPNERVAVWAELFSSMALYESSWNPKSQAVDVGNKKDKDTWSIGLMQISVVDQKSFKIHLGYKFDDLITAKPNLHLAAKIMERQIKARGKVILDNKDSMRYWAVLLRGNKYSKVDQIVGRVRQVPKCL